MTETRWLSPEEREAWLATSALMISLPAALDAQLQADAGLSFFEYMVLAVLAEQPDRTMQMSDIATFASSSLSRLSHAAKRLEKQGYLSRSQMPGAGRRTNATLTDAGHDKVLEAAPGHVAEVRRILIDDASGSDLEVLTRLGNAMKARLGQGCPD